MINLSNLGCWHRRKSEAPGGNTGYEAAAASGAVYGPTLPDGMLYAPGTVVQVVPEPETGITLNLREKAYAGLGNGVTMLSRSDPMHPVVTVLEVYRDGDRFRISEHAYVSENGVYRRVGSRYGGAELFGGGLNTFDSMKGWLHEGGIHPETKKMLIGNANAAIDRENRRYPNGARLMDATTTPWKYASLVDAIEELPENFDLPAPL